MVRPALRGLAGALLGVCLPLQGQINGRVVVGGGGGLPGPAFVMVNCGSYWEGYSDKRGEFIAQFSHGRQVLIDPTFSCTVEATLPGYTRGITHATVHASDVIMVTLYPLGGPDDSTLSYRDLAVPAAAYQQFEKGEWAVRERKWKSAEASLRKAISLYPEYALAWGKLGEALEGSHKPDEAASAYGKAIAIDARLFSVYARWAVMDANRERWDRVAATTDAAIELNPLGWPILFFYNAVANFNLGRLRQAEESAVRAAAADQFPRAHYILGHILATRGDYRGAVEQMSKYLDLMSYAADAKRVRAEIQDARSHMAQLP